jgi:hypothetical protein
MYPPQLYEMLSDDLLRELRHSAQQRRDRDAFGKAQPHQQSLLARLRQLLGARRLDRGSHAGDALGAGLTRRSESVPGH